MKNKLADLRNHLFETLERLNDEESPMELERAKVISLVAQTIINSATVEVKFLNATGNRDSAQFFDEGHERHERQERQERLGPGELRALEASARPILRKLGA